MKLVSVLYLILFAFLGYLFYAAYYGVQVDVAHHESYYLVISPMAYFFTAGGFLSAVLIVVGRWRILALGLLALVSAWGMYGFVTDSALSQEMPIPQQLFLVSSAWFFGPITLVYTVLSAVIIWLGRSREFPSAQE